MTYQVLARKWRPQDFSTLVGQQAVVTALGNALREGRIAQAYLFSGIRGVGKTTAARIFAKALNCEKGPEVGPCNECATCREITAGRRTGSAGSKRSARSSPDDQGGQPCRHASCHVRKRPGAAAGVPSSRARTASAVVGASGLSGRIASEA